MNDQPAPPDLAHYRGHGITRLIAYCAAGQECHHSATTVRPETSTRWVCPKPYHSWRCRSITASPVGTVVRKLSRSDRIGASAAPTVQADASIRTGGCANFGATSVDTSSGKKVSAHRSSNPPTPARHSSATRLFRVRPEKPAIAGPLRAVRRRPDF